MIIYLDMERRDCPPADGKVEPPILEPTRRVGRLGIVIPIEVLHFPRVADSWPAGIGAFLLGGHAVCGRRGFSHVSKPLHLFKLQIAVERNS